MFDINHWQVVQFTLRCLARSSYSFLNFVSFRKIRLNVFLVEYIHYSTDTDDYHLLYKSFIFQQFFYFFLVKKQEYIWICISILPNYRETHKQAEHKFVYSVSSIYRKDGYTCLFGLCELLEQCRSQPKLAEENGYICIDIKGLKKII